jgi:hypothetical protein
MIAARAVGGRRRVGAFFGGGGPDIHPAPIFAFSWIL